MEAYNLMADDQIRLGITPKQREYILRTLVRNLFNFHRRNILDAILNEYTDWSNPQSPPAALRDEIIEALTDCLFTAPIIKAAKIHAAAKKKTKTFFYVFGHSPRGENWTKSLTNEDLPYLLGHVILQANQHRIQTPFDLRNYSAVDRVLSEVMMRYLSNFVISG